MVLTDCVLQLGSQSFKLLRNCFPVEFKISWLSLLVLFPQPFSEDNSSCCVMDRSAVVYLAIIIIKYNLFQALLVYILLHEIILSKDQITVQILPKNLYSFENLLCNVNQQNVACKGIIIIQYC